MNYTKREKFDQYDIWWQFWLLTIEIGILDVQILHWICVNMFY